MSEGTDDSLFSYSLGLVRKPRRNASSSADQAYTLQACTQDA